MKSQQSDTIEKNGITLLKRDGHYILQKTFLGFGQKQVRLGKIESDAFKKASRFLIKAESDGFTDAKRELHYPQPYRNSTSLSYEQVETLYRDYCKESAKAPRDITVGHNLARLKCLMNRAGLSTVNDIRKELLFNKKWYSGVNPTPTEKRTFASAIRAAKSIFKPSALQYYEKKGFRVSNPFLGIEIETPRVSQFTPPPQDVVKEIIESAQKELKPHDAMIVLLAFCGLRRSEIEAITPSNFTVHEDRVILSIEEQGEFQPKSGQSGQVPISNDIYEKLLKLRGITKSPFFVESHSTKTGRGRLWERVKGVNKWLKTKGIKNKPLHSCRKILGSVIAKKEGIPAAAQILRNTQQVCMTYYAGSMSSSGISLDDLTESSSPIRELSKKLGISECMIMEKLGL